MCRLAGRANYSKHGGKLCVLKRDESAERPNQASEKLLINQFDRRRIRSEEGLIVRDPPPGWGPIQSIQAVDHELLLSAIASSRRDGVADGGW